MSEQQEIKPEMVVDLLKLLQNENSNAQGIMEDLGEEETYGEEYVSQLQTVYSRFIQKNYFQVGQLVKWKENLKNRELPYKNQPAIVIAVLDEPIVTNEDASGSPYFRETLDIILGILVNQETFLTFYYDSRRFEVY